MLLSLSAIVSLIIIFKLFLSLMIFRFLLLYVSAIVSLPIYLELFLSDDLPIYVLSLFAIVYLSIYFEIVSLSEDLLISFAFSPCNCLSTNLF